jgi:hypothetical protein
MVIVGITDDCPKCGGKGTLSEEVMNPFEYRMECCDCGYFEERISEYSYRQFTGTVIVPEKITKIGEGSREVEGKLVELKDDKLLKGFKHDLNSGDYKRKGIIQKKPEHKGKYLIVNRWFSSPSHTPTEIIWDDDPWRTEFPSEGNGWKYYPDKD